MLLRVRLTLIAHRDRIHPRESLRHRLDAEVVQREARMAVREPGTDWTAAVIEIDGFGAEAVDDLPFGQLVERRSLEGRDGEDESKREGQVAHGRRL